MADPMLPAARRSPLQGLALPNRGGIVAVTDAGPAARYVYRGAADLVSGAFGVDLPVTPMRASCSGERAALWLGPDEWLLLAPDAEADILATSLAAAVAGRPASLVDVSHRNAGLVVAGPKATRLLASGCPLDLDAEAFPVGMVTRTLFFKAEIVLWRTAADVFRVEMQRSFAAYVTGHLGEAARDVR